MVELKIVTYEDKDFWYTFDKHLPESEFPHIVELKRGYVVYNDGKPMGVWRWNLFWDNTPFITMIYFEESERGKGIGRQVISMWEEERRKEGFTTVMTSTQVDEMAQHFYRKMGYEDCGCLVLNRIPELEQPMEMFMIKKIG